MQFDQLNRRDSVRQLGGTAAWLLAASRWTIGLLSCGRFLQLIVRMIIEKRHAAGFGVTHME